MHDLWGRREGISAPGTPAQAGTPKNQPVTIQSEPSFIEIIDNKIYFYAEIERDKVLQLVKNIRALNVQFLNQQKSFGLTEPIPIYILINSYGGSIFAGLSVMDEIINSDLPVITVVDGCCASAATLFSVVGKRRLMKAHSYMLIHQLTSVFWGKHAEFKDEMENQERLMKMIKDTYKQYTKVPMSKLDELLKHDLWFDSGTCLKYGLIDEIMK
jgi:ATP-dependent protease ClpP protease subunit